LLELISKQNFVVILYFEEAPKIVTEVMKNKQSNKRKLNEV